ncbi:MAG TPA: ATP-binding protein, partial [Sunxiuqinia sp.]|nr:ATP-binding protein [Sunxiuqinia sp.]
MEKIIGNATSIQKDLEWFSQVLKTRLDLYFNRGCEVQSIYDLQAPELEDHESVYADFIHHYQLSFAERILLLLALIPHVKPELLDPLFIINQKNGRGFTEFGGIQGKNHGGFIPTGETFVFIMTGGQLAERFALTELFQADHVFARHHLLKLEPAPGDESFLAGAIHLSRDILDYLTFGEAHRPLLSSKFPAQLISTKQDWTDLVIDEKTMQQIDEIKIWLDFGHQLLYEWEMSHKLRKGYRCLFYGPPGTGKTMTACLLGKDTNRDVYRIDLSLVVSKYIGETEKNLSNIFDLAENKDWILFFDEADALFGKRTSVSDSHDRYANQEVSYLLQRIEDYNGLVLLASNQKENMDEAFTRRFDNIINFGLPRPDQRLKIWEQAFSSNST